MGVFRKHKAKQYTLEQARTNADTAMSSIRQAAESASDEQLRSLLHDWAEWTELVARHEGRNESDIH